MKYTKHILFLLIALTAIILSCEKDDICAAETPTTPQLILRFYDIASQDDTKVVTGLLAYTFDDMDNVIAILGEGIATRDSIAIPLRTDMNSTNFVLHAVVFVLAGAAQPFVLVVCTTAQKCRGAHALIALW